MRLFLAVDLADSLRADVQQITVALRQRLERLKHATRVGWLGPDRFHFTLVFIGEVSDAVAGDVKARFMAPLPVRPFVIHVGGLGMFPPGGRPRVIWLGVDEGADDMRRLHHEVLARLDGVPFARESRAFSPHLTLARFREPGTISERQALAEVRLPAAMRSPVDHVTLYQSRLSPKGSIYTPLRQTPLSGEVLA
jgi:2'-5' RNA ligase